jgi:hypothetical protein
MAKALWGTHTTPSSLRLLDEVRALRQRVAELETALAEAEAVRARREDAVDEVTLTTEREPATT